MDSLAKKHQIFHFPLITVASDCEIKQFSYVPLEGWTQSVTNETTQQGRIDDWPVKRSLILAQHQPRWLNIKAISCFQISEATWKVLNNEVETEVKKQFDENSKCVNVESIIW